jgi:hypothetical protein
MPKPLQMSDDQLTAILRAAEPLQPHDRGPFLEAVAALLQGCEIGDGAVARAAREAQRRFLHPPQDTGLQHAPKFYSKPRANDVGG